jgi:hypothetical protein
VFLFGDQYQIQGMPRKQGDPGLRPVAGARPMDKAILERDLMQFAKKPPKLKKSLFRTTVYRQKQGS